MQQRQQNHSALQAYRALEKRIMRRLATAGAQGLNRGQLYLSLSRPITRRSLDVALNSLRQRGLALARRVETGHPGRPAEVWYVRAKPIEETPA